MSDESVARLRSWLGEQGLDAFLVMQPQNRSYLTGWLNDDVEGAGVLLVGQQEQILLTNSLYGEVAQKEAVGWDVVASAGRDYPKEIIERARVNGWKTLGFEAEAITFAEYDKIRRAGENELVLQAVEKSPIDGWRWVKQAGEIELLKKAVAITDETFAHVCGWIQGGVTEKEVQWEIARKMVELGADGPSFETIVASGPNGSMPHAHASERRIQRGELITIDMGARYKGYCADMTRTICLGEPTEERMREVYEAVLDAMKTCEAGLRAGITARDADALAREALARRKLDEYFIHSTGHGVGLQVHEGPYLSQRAPEDMTLVAGNVVTVEPGVYIAGWSGTRVEDCVLIKEDGVEVLTQSSTNLVIQR